MSIHLFFTSLRSVRLLLWCLCAAAAFALFPAVSYAATLGVTPNTGVYGVGNTFTVRVVVNTQGQSINAAEGQLSFSPSELSVVSVTRASSIFSLWTTEPAFSNSTGRVSFGGGSPQGYTGSGGTVMSVTFKTLKAGSPRVTFASGSVLAADGMGTNVLSGMQGGAYTVNPAGETPEPEYVALPNTPSAPSIKSTTHPDPTAWYKEKTAQLSWSVPSGVTGVRTLLDDSASTIPTVVYDSPITERTIDDLPEGVSYFHLQFRNADGWGKVAHYRLAIDTEAPSAFTIEPHEDNDTASPAQQLRFKVTDASSGVSHYLVQIDGGEAVRFDDTEGAGVYRTPELPPGRHTLVVEAFDKAGNSIVSTHAFDITAFEPPVFTEYPTEINEQVIPVIRGTTRPNARVTVSFGAVGAFGSGQATAATYEVESNAEGVFTFIPDSRLSQGVYELSAYATSKDGARSESSSVIRIAVQQPGYVRLGSFVVSLLSIMVPILALLVLLGIGTWYSWHRIARLRKKLRKEVTEAEQSLVHEFDVIVQSLKTAVDKLEESRKGKLTKGEQSLIKSISTTLENAEKRVEKEIKDIERIIK